MLLHRATWGVRGASRRWEVVGVRVQVGRILTTLDSCLARLPREEVLPTPAPGHHPTPARPCGAGCGVRPDAWTRPLEGGHQNQLLKYLY